MSKVKDFFKVGEVFGYIGRMFKKNDGSHPTSFSLKMMHGINKISILMFLMALIVIIVRRVF